MRILHIDTGSELRGGQRQVLLLLDALRQKGHECLLLARENGALWDAAVTVGFSVYKASVAEVWRRSPGATLVHAHDARAHTLAALSSRCKVVVSRRVAFPVQRSFASRWKYGRASRFLAVSGFVANQLRAARIDEERIDIVYDGVESTVSSEPWKPAYPAVAIASRDPQKGRDLIEIAALSAGIPVVFSDDLEADLREASMFIYITRSEGLGSAVLLAMSMGVPVIASREGGLPEVVSNGISGLLVANDTEEIAQAMRALLREPRLACSLIEEAKVNIAQRFTKQLLVERTIASYEKALSG